MALQLFFRIDKALVASGNIVVHLNAEDVAVLRVGDNLVRVVWLQAVRPDAYVVGPVLSRGIGGRSTQHHQ